MATPESPPTWRHDPEVQRRHTAQPARGETEPAALALRILAKRWSIQIIQVLAVRDSYFLELQRMVPGVRHKVLGEHLRMLESLGALSRRAHGLGRRVTYTLTARGRALLPVIAVLRDWGAKESDGEPRQAE